MFINSIVYCIFFFFFFFFFSYSLLLQLIHFHKTRSGYKETKICSRRQGQNLLCDGSSDHGVGPLSYFSFQPVLHDWCNKGRGMCYPLCGMVHIKEPSLFIDKSSLCGGSGFHFSLSEWSLTICLTPYNRR